MASRGPPFAGHAGRLAPPSNPGNHGNPRTFLPGREAPGRPRAGENSGGRSRPLPHLRGVGRQAKPGRRRRRLRGPAAARRRPGLPGAEGAWPRRAPPLAGKAGGGGGAGRGPGRSLAAPVTLATLGPSCPLAAARPVWPWIRAPGAGARSTRGLRRDEPPPEASHPAARETRRRVLARPSCAAFHTGHRAGFSACRAPARAGPGTGKGCVGLSDSRRENSGRAPGPTRTLPVRCPSGAACAVGAGSPRKARRWTRG